ncbi:MAG: hypothetical protein JST68_09945 [Bacteroidetes bacterium]|nr:hypothetical protein [Bacteroidota bacterium]
MDNANDKQLSFPQRNWFLICILVAILSPIVVNWVTAAAHKESKRESMEKKPVEAVSPGGGGVTPAPGGAGADSAGKDTSYKMSAPPADSGKKGAGGAGGGAGGSGGAGGAKK